MRSPCGMIAGVPLSSAPFTFLGRNCFMSSSLTSAIGKSSTTQPVQLIKCFLEYASTMQPTSFGRYMLSALLKIPCRPVRLGLYSQYVAGKLCLILTVSS